MHEIHWIVEARKVHYCMHYTLVEHYYRRPLLLYPRNVGLLPFFLQLSRLPIEFYCHLLCILVPSDALHRLDEDLEPHWRGRWRTFGPGKLAVRPHLECHQCNTYQRARKREKLAIFSQPFLLLQRMIKYSQISFSHGGKLPFILSQKMNLPQCENCSL